MRFDHYLDQIKHDIQEIEASMDASTGVVLIKGKKYSTVGLRLFKLREYFGTSITISTNIIENTDDEYSVKDVVENGKTIQKKYVSKYGKICIEAKIFLNWENNQLLIANGFAEKIRQQNNITRGSCMEFCQTSAIGRACASLGILGDHNISSAEEMYGKDNEILPDKSIN
tara:strand:+ start:976 stop:1488 length:513 start_codon:yes stop_codon:yes gene_type:complete